MKRLQPILRANDEDALRLLGLSRIPRCAECDVLDALRVAHETREPLSGPLPPAPRDCGDQVCRPLITRYVRPFPTLAKERPAS
jgi:hypothetical protein